jgi:hypothetical protein
MATYRYATKDLSITTAQAFVNSITENDPSSSVYYVVLGNTLPYPDEPTPILPEDNEQYLKYELHRRFIGGKKISSSDVSHVAPRYNWTSGTVYSMYRDTDIDMYDRPFYVVTNEYNVYKCLYNNKGASSTIKPTGYSATAFTTSDGYTWKYMYTISLGEADKFMTSSFIPVKTLTSSDGSIESSRQLAIQNASVNGAIEVIETVSQGSGYSQILNGSIESAGRNTLRISILDSPSPIDNFYNGSSVYINAGTGAGQIRRIIDYSGSTKTLVVNTQFATTPNTDSRVIISPTVTIIGDGSGAKAYSTVDENTGAIANISMIDTGSSYTRASVKITANSIHGSGATANVVISPLGGHGADPIRELFADKVIINSQFSGTEGVSANGNGYIPSNTEFRTISVLKNPILKCDSNNNFITNEVIANTSNSPSTLRFTTRLKISYIQMNNNVPVTPLQVGDIITNERNRLRAELGRLEFITELSLIKRRNESLQNAVLGANGNVVYIRNDETETDPSFFITYINNVDSYSNYIPFTKDDIILTSESEEKIATVETIKGPEANTYSGEVIFTENVQAVRKDLEQTEDIKIILDF